MHALSHWLNPRHQAIDNRHAPFPFLDRSLRLRQRRSIIDGLQSCTTQVILELFPLLMLSTEALRGRHMFRLRRLPACVYLLSVASQCHVLELFFCKTWPSYLMALALTLTASMPGADPSSRMGGHWNQVRGIDGS